MELETPLAVLKGEAINTGLENGFTAFYFLKSQKTYLSDFIEEITKSYARDKVQIFLETDRIENVISILPANAVYADRYIVRYAPKSGDPRNFVLEIPKKIPVLFRKLLILSYGVRNFSLESLDLLVEACQGSKVPLPAVAIVEIVPDKEYVEFCKKHNILIYVWDINQANSAIEELARQNETDIEDVTASILFQNKIGAITDDVEIKYNIFDFEPTLDYARSSVRSRKNNGKSPEFVCSGSVCYKAVPSKTPRKIIDTEVM